MASVIGLAPIRPDLKGRLRELLCIHGQKRVVPEVGIAPTSPRLQRGANLPQLPEVFAHGESWSSRAVTLRGLRLHLPAALRERLSLWVAKPWVISIGIEGHLRVLPEELWSKYIRRLAHEIIRASPGTLLHPVIIQSAVKITIDRTNRWSIPVSLANKVEIGGANNR